MTSNLPKPFVIMAKKRTGSTMLKSALNSHPKIKCYGEIFRHDKELQELAGIDKLSQQVLTEYSEAHDRQNFINIKPVEFLNRILQQHEGLSNVGFKLMPAHNLQLLEHLLVDSQYKRIFIRRDNILASYSSEKIARLTGQGMATNSNKIKTVKVEFDCQEFSKYFKVRNKAYDEMKNQLESANGSYLAVEYLDFKSADGYKRVLEYLEADATYNIAPVTKKRNTSSIIERFSNIETVKEYLHVNNLEQWEYEA